jgi:large subunit ribosomal protein L23
MKTIWDVIKAPVVTEKAMKAKGDLGETIGNQVLTFIVAHSANKNSIKYAVETIFKRKVGAVRIVNGRGQEVRRGRLVGRKPDFKKAYVTLQKGERLDDFGEVI